MNNFNLTSIFSGGMAGLIFTLGSVFFLIIIWSLFWKSLALWHSARRGKAVWFVIFLFVNTLGILEIIYLFFILKLKLSHLFSKK